MEKQKYTPEPGSFVRYAGGAYEVADVVDHFGCLFVRIYDEPPSRHIDEIKLSSVELITVPELLEQLKQLKEENERLKELLKRSLLMLPSNPNYGAAWDAPVRHVCDNLRIEIKEVLNSLKK